MTSEEITNMNDELGKQFKFVFKCTQKHSKGNEKNWRIVLKFKSQPHVIELNTLWAICISMLLFDNKCHQTTGHLPEVRVTGKLRFWKQTMSNENRQITLFSKCFIVLCDCKEVLFLKKSLKI